MVCPKIPLAIVERDGPFREFKQDASIVSLELADGRTLGRVLLVYPNEIWAVDGKDELPFDPAQVVRAFQTADDLATRSSSEWRFFGEADAI